MHTGRCLCGAVVLEITSLRPDYGACHCTMCRRWTGSAFLGINVPARDLTVHGVEHIGRFTSSAWAERAFCTRCGSGLWYRVTAEDPLADAYEIPIGLLDDPSGLQMTREIYVDEQPDSYGFTGVRPRLTTPEVHALYGHLSGQQT